MRIDPYFVWRLFRGDIPWDEAAACSDKIFSVLVQRKDPSKLLIETALLDPTLDAQAVEFGIGELNDQYIPSHVHCVSAEAAGLCFQPGLVSAQGLLSLMLVAPQFAHRPWNNIARAELALSRSANAQGIDPAPRRRAGKGDSAPTVPTLGELADLLAKQWKATGLKRSAFKPGQPVLPRRGVDVCIIDDRCNFASATLAAGAGSKVKQVQILGGDKEALEAFDGTGRYIVPIRPLPGGAGFQISGCLLGRLLNTAQFEPGRSPVGLPPQVLADEPGTYKAVKYIHPAPHGSHGAAVLDLIANPWLRIGDRAWPRLAPPEVRFAQLPVATVVDTSGASLSPHVLDAIHDALAAANACQDVIVNLSFGTHGGPHDGKSMIESAFVELLNRFDGSATVNGKRLILVVPAGNSHLLRCHASDWAMPGAHSEFDWKVWPDDDTDNIVEIWLPRDAKASIEVTLPGSTDVVAIVADPDLAEGVFVEMINVDGRDVGMLMYVKAPPQSDTSALVLLALIGNKNLDAGAEVSWTVLKATPWIGLKATQPSCEPNEPDRCLETTFAPHGIWHVEIKTVDGRPVNWHAFVQRGDQAPMRRRTARGVIGRQSYIVDSDWSRANPMFTLNGIATAVHKRLFVVGALERADGRLADYSGSGPARVSLDRTCGPDVVVAADESRRRKGLLVQGVLGGARHRVSGTSMAAATVTRHLWEWLQAKRDLDQFRTFSPSPTTDPAPTKHGPETADFAPELCRGESHRIVSQRPDGGL